MSNVLSPNKHRPIILLDVDDVLLECNEIAVWRWNSEHPEETPMTLDEISGWGFLGKRTDELIPYYRDEDFYRDQQPYEGAVQAVRELSCWGEVYFLTSVPSSVVSYRVEQLKRYFPFVPESHIFIGGVKNHFVADYSLDDGPHHIKAQLEDGSVKYPVLFRKPWNRDISGIMSVNSLEDFLTFVSFMESRTEMFEKERPTLICLVGPSGSNKGELASELCKRGFELIPSYTDGEVRKPGYIYVQKFNIADYSESTCYAGVNYGTRLLDVLRVFDSGKDAVIAIDICGAITYKRLLRAQCIMVFCKTDTDTQLRSVLKKTCSDDEKVLRLKWLSAENKNCELCQFTVDNSNPFIAAEAISRYIN